MKNEIDDIRFRRYKEKIDHLKKYYNFTLNWYVNNDDFKINQEKKGYQELFSIYHAIQLTIEAIIDVSAMLVKDLGDKPIDNYKNLQILQNEEIIEGNIQENLFKLIGLRNRITHDYNGLIDNIALDSYRENHKVIQNFIKKVEKWLTSQ
ncbi:MAG: DUF86 domain-containing protein [Promethearchaeota archaeon]